MSGMLAGSATVSPAPPKYRPLHPRSIGPVPTVRVPHLPACVTVSKRMKLGPGVAKPQHPGTVVVVAPGTVVVVVVDPGAVVVVVATVVVVVPIGIGSVGMVIVGIGTCAICTDVFATMCAWPGLSPRTAKLGSTTARRRPKAARTRTTSLIVRLLPGS